LDERDRLIWNEPLGEYFRDWKRGYLPGLRDGSLHERSVEFQYGELRVSELQDGDLVDEGERRRTDHDGKHLTEFWDEEPVEPEGESRHARTKLEKREPELRTGDGTPPTVSVSALAILFVCEVGEPRRPEELAAFRNLHRGWPTDFAGTRASNHFSASIRFA
jgi:hypothetical protein